MILLKTAYLGWNFHGSQIQPDARTVEGHLNEELLKQGVFIERKGMASRTDTGVSALGNVHGYLGKLPMLKKLNYALTDVAVWAVATVPDDFHLRGASLRKYRYFLLGDYSSADILKLKEFEGSHDFREYTKDRENTTSTINSITLKVIDGGWQIDFEAQKFLWNQIRRLIGTITGKTADAEPLILRDVLYENEPDWVFHKWALRPLESKLKKYQLRTKMLETFTGV